MSLITLRFFVFLCITLLLYYLLPKRFQWIVLLSASLFFYFSASPYYFIFLITSAVTTFITGLAIDPEKSKTGSAANRKLWLIVCLTINIGILCFVKYAPFNHIFPLGISFYTFIVISYIADVYRGDVAPEKNFLKYLLFVSWFPQIIEGPINVYGKIKDSLFAERDFDFDNCKRAGYRILTGLFKKTVIAGRFSVYVDTVYADIGSAGGLTLLCTVVFYAIQLYADFSGCMDMVLGISGLFGVTMEENFRLPFFSKSSAEVWKRWHISLGTWFRKYVYDTVFKSTFSKRLKSYISKTRLKKYSINIVAAVSLALVWTLTGIWHGDNIKFLFYGLYWGIIIITSTFLAKTYKKFRKSFPKLCHSKLYSVFEILRTCLIICIGFTIFRADTLQQALYIFKTIITDFHINAASIGDALLPFTGDNTAISYGLVSVFSALALYVTEIFEYNGINTFKQHKYACALVLIVATLVFGVFGQSGFLYMAY